MVRMRFTPIMAAFVAAAILIPATLAAHTTFQRTFGGPGRDSGCSVRQTADGGYVIAGTTESYGAGRQDVYLVRTDSSGNVLWSCTYGGESLDYGNSVSQTSDGGFIVAGSTESYGAGYADMYLIRTDAHGETLWTRTLGGPHDDEATSVLQTPDGDFTIGGSSVSYSGWSDADPCLASTDSSGSVHWVKAHDIFNWDYGYSMERTRGGNYVIAGGAYGFIGGRAYVLMADDKGDEMWTTSYGPEYSRGQAVLEAADGGIAVVGGDASADRGSVSLVKFGANGESLWGRKYGDGMGYAAIETDDSGFVIAGCTGAGTDAYLVRTNASGDPKWMRIFGGPDNEVLQSVQPTADGGYIMTGTTRSYGAGGSDVYLIKTDADGNVGVADGTQKPQATSRRLSTTVVRSLPEGSTVFDPMGRRVASPKAGIYFVRQSSAVTKVVVPR
ncbi:hypothetical protein FJY68_00235 [candidate division WOR-3 bacterium]|uniref:Bulb-type lectin domain-containing protein n=1 Tax=candidate division WOR-3 bacterium TaxID=2052148 RepID=A0A937XEM3_UNCW3|nr:hypothetical protein [candidate division WOR-3 bacterium]